MIRNYTLYGFVLFFTWAGCKPVQQEKITLVKSWLVDFEDGSVDRRVPGNAKSGNYFTHADSNMQYSYAVRYVLPDSVRKKFIRVCFELDARLVKRRFGQSIVIGLQKADSIFFWQTFDVNGYTKNKDKWVHIIDSTQFFYDIASQRQVELRVFGFNSFRKAGLDIDNMMVKIKQVEPVEN